jgi:hypothetical protein
MKLNDRLTVSLAPGQRAALEALAQENGMKLAQVVRYALNDFIERNSTRRLDLNFPDDWPVLIDDG